MVFQVTFEYLSNASAACTRTAGDIQADLAGLRTYVVSLENDWQGIAAGTFQDLMAEYDRCAASLNNALTGIANGLHGNWGNYEQNEQAAITSISNIQQGLPPVNLG